MLIALQDFQAQYKLTVSGQLDDATKAQLLQVHGC
jgi:peptidoglycan hydrolase-like protein with peptidoglycan-binding domain